MYFLNKFCCICMNKSDLKHLFDEDNVGVSHYNKLTSSIAEMQFKELNHQRLICGECCVTLNTVYNLINYISLQTYSHVGTMTIKKEIEIKCENEDDNFGDISTSHCLLKIKSDPDEISAGHKCCICLRDKSDLKHLFDVDNDGVSHYNKLTSSIAELNFKKMNNQRFICGECCVTLNTVYTFRQTCLSSKTNLITYISQLQTFSKVSGTLSVYLTDIKHETKVVKEEIEIKCENEGRLKENNQQNEFQTVCYEDRIKFPASVKEEYESEEDAHEDATADHMNEDAYSFVKVEKVEHQTMIKDEPYIEYTEIGIEDPLAIVKEEPMSDSETPQDGSTSQADAGTSEEQLKREETTIGTEHNIQKVLYMCEICKKSFNHKGNFKYHMQIHSGERPFECEICKKSFLQKCVYKMHLKIHSLVKFQCKVCKKCFNRKSNYNLHMKIHSGERPHECNICHKNFSSKSHLTVHLRTHGERLYECEICQKGFTLKKYLNVHIKTHSGERPHECKICRKSFTVKRCLVVHMKIHSGERPFECETCHKKFINKNHLIVHLKTHGERAYECEICRKGFTLKKYLDNHMKKHSTGTT